MKGAPTPGQTRPAPTTAHRSGSRSPYTPQRTAYRIFSWETDHVLSPFQIQLKYDRHLLSREYSHLYYKTQIPVSSRVEILDSLSIVYILKTGQLRSVVSALISNQHIFQTFIARTTSMHDCTRGQIRMLPSLPFGVDIGISLIVNRVALYRR